MSANDINTSQFAISPTWSRFLINFTLITLSYILILWIIRPASILVVDRQGYLNVINWGRLILISIILAMITVGIVWYINSE